MKKLMILFLIIALSISLFAGCKENDGETTENTTTTKGTTQATTTAATTTVSEPLLFTP